MGGGSWAVTAEKVRGPSLPGAPASAGRWEGQVDRSGLSPSWRWTRLAECSRLACRRAELGGLGQRKQRGEMGGAGSGPCGCWGGAQELRGLIGAGGWGLGADGEWPPALTLSRGTFPGGRGASVDWGSRGTSCTGAFSGWSLF